MLTSRFKRGGAALSTLLAGAALASLLAAPPASAANNDPLIMVHGFLGFGPDDLAGSGFRYWGGTNDVVGHLRERGHPVFAAAVGPVSSNWDRAVELYYQIKGGCADYGAAHSAANAAFGALQKPAGKCWALDPANNPHHYPVALYPAWDASHPIHLLAHSQGGQTIRTMIALLENGAPGGKEGDGALFAGGKTGWVTSATSISTPHNGTTLRDVIVDYVPQVSELTGKIIEVAGLGGSNNPGYQFRLEQFGLAQGPAESFRDFFERIKGARFWSLANHDSAQWDLGPDGARELNNWVTASPHVYYYSIGGDATEPGSACCNNTDRVVAPFQNAAYRYARNDMIFFSKPTAGEWVVPSVLQRGMGSYTQSDPGRVVIDSAWFANDGVVNTVSMKAPAGQAQRDYDGTSVRGAWNHLGIYRGYDHFDVIGWLNPAAAVYPLYERVSDIIYGL
ncbi:triacylglycerol lipase [Oxalobacteraceae bacterium GrIS 1.11]